MISDVLFEASETIKEFLKEPAFDKVYEGEMRKQVEALVYDMDAVREKLDKLPEEEKLSCR